MTATHLVLGSLLDIGAAVTFALVGVITARRVLPAHARHAGTMFGVWWAGLAALTLVAGPGVNGGMLGLVAAARGVEGAPPGAILAFALGWLFFACAALWGLLAFLVYLFTGRDVVVLLGGIYALLFAFFAYIAVGEHPERLIDETWGVKVQYGVPVSGLGLAVLLVFLELPHIVGAAFYATLLRKADSRATRYRIGLVAGALLVWFALSLVAGILGIESTPSWLLFARFLGLASALVILAAYAPPRAWRGWIVQTVEAESENRARLRERVRELV